MPKEGDLRVWWIPQVPGQPFIVPVKTTLEGRLLLDTLAEYDMFQLRENIKPDFSNAGGLNIWEDGEWVDYCDEEGDEIDHEKYERRYDFEWRHGLS